jgi:pentatricopeptide repeat protein
VSKEKYAKGNVSAIESFSIFFISRSMRYDLPEAQNINIRKATALLKVMQERHDFLPSTLTLTPFLFVLCEAGRLNRAHEFFDEMKALSIPLTVRDYTPMIKMYLRNKRPGRAIQLYDEMVSLGIKPDLLCMELMIQQCAVNKYIQKSLEYLHTLCQTGEFPSPRALRPLIHNTKGYVTTWDEIRRILSLSRVPKPLLDTYCPKSEIRGRRLAHPLTTDRSVRTRRSPPRPPMKSPKRLKVREVTISQY